MVDILVPDLDDETVRRLDAMAKSKGVSVNDIALEALAAYVATETKEREPQVR